jgi:hypothetical protein
MKNRSDAISVRVSREAKAELQRIANIAKTRRTCQANLSIDVVFSRQCECGEGATHIVCFSLGECELVDDNVSDNAFIERSTQL